MTPEKSTYKQLVYPALGACQEMHKHLGPFLNEYMYQDALAIELSLRGISFQRGQQLWIYMRLTGIQYGMLYNFAPVYAQCEKYHYDPHTFKMVAF